MSFMHICNHIANIHLYSQTCPSSRPGTAALAEDRAEQPDQRSSRDQPCRINLKAQQQGQPEQGDEDRQRGDQRMRGMNGLEIRTKTNEGRKMPSVASSAPDTPPSW